MSPSIRTPGPGDPAPSRALAPPSRPESNYDRLEEKLTALAASMNRWQRDLDSANNRATRLEGAFSVLLTSLEGWKSDVREVASRTEARVLRGLEVIDNRITRTVPARIEPDIARLEETVRVLHAEVAKLRELLPAPAKVDTANLEAVQALHAEVAKLRELYRAPAKGDTADLEEAVQALHAEVAKLHELPPTSAKVDTANLEEAVQALHAEVAKLRELPHAGARLEAQILETLEAIKNAPNGIEAEGKTLGSALTVMLKSLEAVKEERNRAEHEIQASLTQGLEKLEKAFTERMAGLSAELSSQKDHRNWASLGEGLSILDRRLQSIEDRLSATAGPEMPASLGQALSRLEARLVYSEEAFGRKLQSVQAGSDENNATQLRYLAGLEELQATLVNRMKNLEGTLANPLDAQQWERLAKGLEFLDSRLAQSYDSVANRLDTAISALTNALDNRTAAGQEANLKSAERIWRALTGLEDKVTGSGEATRQSQERIEKATSNLAGALEELRAITGARAGHTEKLLMEALENLDGRFSQNLMAVSESLSSAIFALNKATGEWRSELFNSSEESEERVVKEINDAEAKLAASLKSGLEALGRREERLLALILGGGAAFSSASEELTDSPD